MAQFNYESIVIEVLDDYIKNVKKNNYEVKLESRLMDDLGIDSLDTIEIGFMVVEKFGIKVPVDLLLTMTVPKVSDLVDFLKKNS
jgi:acyl carrier protein